MVYFELKSATTSIVSLLAPNQTDMIIIKSISIRKPSAAKSESCDNAVTIKCASEGRLITELELSGVPQLNIINAYPSDYSNG